MESSQDYEYLDEYFCNQSTQVTVIYYIYWIFMIYDKNKEYMHHLINFLWLCWKFWPMIIDKSPSPSWCKFAEVGLKFMWDLLRQLKTGKAVGLGNIHARLLVDSAYVLANFWLKLLICPYIVEL